MRKSFIAVAAGLLGISAIGTMAPAFATKPDSDDVHKVWVCHATAGEGELKNGYNLIYVDVASTVPNNSFHGENDHYGHSTTSPKNNSKYGLLYDIIDGVGPNSDCGGPGEPPPMPSKDPVESTTAVQDCVKLEVTETSTVTKYTYTWDGTEWVEDESTTTEVTTRDMTDEEAAECPTQGEPPPMPSKDAVEVMTGSEPDCDTLKVTETYDVTEFAYTWDGEVWVESQSTTQDLRTRDMTDEEAAACPTEASQGPVPPAAAPTVVEAPVVETPTPVAEAPQVAPTPTALPSTGSETWTIFLIGLATLLAGAGLLALSRRPA